MVIADLIAGLSQREAYQPRPDRVEVRQTHISVVFLAGEFVYKIKKPLRLSWLDSAPSSCAGISARRRSGSTGGWRPRFISASFPLLEMERDS